MSISVTLTNEQFYHLYKDSEFLRGMSFSAVDGLLDYISEISTERGVVEDWTPYFMDAGVYTQSNFISEFSSVLEPDEIESHDDDLEELAISISENMDKYVRIIYNPGEDNTYLVI